MIDLFRACFSLCDVYEQDQETPPQTKTSIDEVRTEALKATPSGLVAFELRRQSQKWVTMSWESNPSTYFERRGKTMRMSDFSLMASWKFFSVTEAPKRPVTSLKVYSLQSAPSYQAQVV